jgi:hypothetical protein
VYLFIIPVVEVHANRRENAFAVDARILHTKFCQLPLSPLDDLTTQPLVLTRVDGVARDASTQAIFFPTLLILDLTKS